MKGSIANHDMLSRWVLATLDAKGPMTPGMIRRKAARDKVECERWALVSVLANLVHHGFAVYDLNGEGEQVYTSLAVEAVAA